VPLFYRLRLLRRHLAHRRRLSRQCDILYVASPALATRCESARPWLLTPVASQDDEPMAAGVTGKIRVAFHSTSVHAAEHRWLRPVMQTALTNEPAISFEVIAGAPLSWPWRTVRGAQIVSPMPWPRYRAESRAHGADLLLAPLLPSSANSARSWTKRIDAMRLGAALLVSDPELYRLDPEERALGMYVPLEPGAWHRAIRELARDRDRLTRLRDLNRAHVLRANATADPLIIDAMLPG
jgi:hypothetical protein